MGKYEHTLKQMQLKNLLSEKKYEKALEMTETMIGDIYNTDVSELKLYADIYRKCARYDKARELYHVIYNEIPTRRNLYNLIVLCIKSLNINEAEELFTEYSERDKDIDCLILRYRIDKAKNVDRSIILRDLEEINKSEFLEEWAYELAKQYHKSGMIEECIETCRQIILWFSDGEIAEKAKLLKMHHEGEVSDDLMSGIEQSIGNDVSKYMEAAENEEEPVEESTISEEPETAEAKESNISSFAKYIDYKYGCNHLEEEKGIVKDNLSFALASESQETIMTTVQSISKTLDKFDIMKNPKIARIDAANLNNINLDEEVNNLIGTCILIENASEMSMKTINSVIKVIDLYPDKIAVILADKEEMLSKMLFKEEILRNQLAHFILL